MNSDRGLPSTCLHQRISARCRRIQSNGRPCGGWHFKSGLLHHVTVNEARGFAVTEITHRTVQANGILIHPRKPAGAACRPLPRFSRILDSWRTQLRALADAGFHAVAPDMRGYGQTDRPEEIEKYTLFILSATWSAYPCARRREGGHRRPRLGRAGRLARGAPAARPVSRRRRTERAVLAAWALTADERHAPDETALFSSSISNRASPRRSWSATRATRSVGCCFRSGDARQRPQGAPEREAIGMVPRSGGFLTRMVAPEQLPSVVHRRRWRLLRR